MTAGSGAGGGIEVITGSNGWLSSISMSPSAVKIFPTWTKRKTGHLSGKWEVAAWPVFRPPDVCTLKPNHSYLPSMPWRQDILVYFIQYTIAIILLLYHHHLLQFLLSVCVSVKVSSKILKIESCVSFYQVAYKHFCTNFQHFHNHTESILFTYHLFPTQSMLWKMMRSQCIVFK